MALAVGGLTLAAGALSLVRLTSGSVTDGGGGTAEAQPRIGSSDVVGSTADSVAATPSPRTASRRASAAMGGVSATPSARTTAHPSSSAPRAADPATGIPEAPSTPTASETPEPSAPPTSAAPLPTPSPTTTPEDSDPDTSAPGLCVPVIGLCVNDLSSPKN
ncbi:hypothetical protein BIV24_16400 [Streptomyces colonosanans]|uniref:Uncharacterized protein n=2 Tax=Streptomyces colonosanans TaxID=1428652 RepID=A0A1S2PBP8_9ACTN|nr:hypothetical protein BIV24_16400 [Streptomyces colonosanans]